MAEEQQGQEGAQSAQVNLKVLEGLNLGESELATLKANESLLTLVTHLTEQKRTANAEAKKHRELLESIEQDKKARTEEALKKQGEYQKLYEDAQQKLSKKDELVKKALINGELQRLAGMHGLAKSEYIKLLDESGINVDLESLKVTGADELFTKFKEDNPALFNSKSQANGDNSQPRTSESKSDKLNLYQKLKQKKNKTPSEITRVFVIEKELKKEGILK